MRKFLIVAVVLVVVAGGGWYLWQRTHSAPAPVVTPSTQMWSTYTSSTLGLSIMYPPGYTLDAQYAYDQFGPAKLINGIKVTVSPGMATGTNLSSDTYVSVEQLPRAKHCTGDIYLTDNVTAHNISEGGIDYSFASSTGAGAGNRYEEDVYVLATSTPCTAVRYFIHYGAIENFPAGAVQEFDRSALISDFDKIRRSLVVGK